MIIAELVENYGYEKMVTYRCEKFWQSRDRPKVRPPLNVSQCQMSLLPQAQYWGMALAHGHGKLQKSVSYIRHPYEDELTAVNAESFFRLNFH